MSQMAARQQAAVRSMEGASALKAIVLTTALGAAACTAAIESETNVFATIAEARLAGAIGKGWVPDGLPASTHEIREAHVPARSERWGLFNFHPSDGDALRRLLQADELPLGSLRCDPPGRLEWWPVALRGRLNEDLGITGVRAYRARDSDLVFAVNWKQGRAYYWSERRD